jgi:transcriptional regulator with XRE-family HTH domain
MKGRRGKAMAIKACSGSSPVASVGARLRRLRRERKLSQSDLARQIGIQQSDLSRMEKGEYRVSLDNLFKLLGALGVSVSEFFAGDTRSQAPAPVARPLSQGDMQILQVLRQLSSTAREEVQEFAEFKLRRERAERRRIDLDQNQERHG